MGGGGEICEKERDINMVDGQLYFPQMLLSYHDNAQQYWYDLYRNLTSVRKHLESYNNPIRKVLQRPFPFQKSKHKSRLKNPRTVQLTRVIAEN